MNKKLNVIGIERHRRSAGVYIFLNIVEKKAYVGQTSDNGTRFDVHLKGLFIPPTESHYTGTNINMRKEKNKAFEVVFFPVEYHGNINILYDYETALMCICRKNGLLLYNGNEDHSTEDLNRLLLISQTMHSDTDWWKICQVNNYLKSDVYEEIYCKISQDFDNWAQKTYHRTFSSVINMTIHERIKIWKSRIQFFKDPSNDYLWINSENAKIHAQKKLTVKDMEHCNIKEKKLSELSKNIDMTYSIWSSFGVYATQGPITILKTKQHDLKIFRINKSAEINIHNFNIIENSSEDSISESICFWALKQWEVSHKVESLACKTNQSDTYTGPRLLFLPYTSSSNAIDISSINLGIEMELNESCEHYLQRLKAIQSSEINKHIFANGYKINKDTITFPENMFPMVITPSGQKMAFLITKFHYIAEITTTDELNRFKHLFTPIYKNKQNQTRLNEITNKRQPCYLTTLDLSEFDSYINNLSKIENTEVKLLVAELTYPYIVNISKNT